MSVLRATRDHQKPSFQVYVTEPHVSVGLRWVDTHYRAVVVLNSISHCSIAVTSVAHCPSVTNFNLPLDSCQTLISAYSLQIQIRIRNRKRRDLGRCTTHTSAM